MTKDTSKIIDWRSTGRRHARRELFKARVDFCCVGYTDLDGINHPCGKTTTDPPKDAPSWFADIWPESNRVLSPQALQADHETKDLTNNSLEFLNWRCASCHKLQDMRSDKGEATVSNVDPWGGIFSNNPNPVGEVQAIIDEIAESFYNNNSLISEESTEDDLWPGL